MKILLVDDEQLITESLEMLLEDDFTIITSNDPEEAFEILKQDEDIGLIISDHRMPKMTGCKLLEKIKDIRPNTYRMILTGYGDAKELLRGQKVGAVHKILVKPWDPDILISNINFGLSKCSK